MSRIVKDDPNAPPEKSLSKRQSQTKQLGLIREQLKAQIKRYDDEAVWDSIQAKDLPAEMIDYVQEMLQAGFDYNQIRRQLGILRATDKAWRKISSALKQGFRIDGNAYLVQKGFEMQAMSNKLKEQIMKAFDEGIEVPNKDGGVTVVKGPSKELSMAVDTYNRLQQGFVKLGKDLGAFVENEGGKGPAGGVTIVVQTNVPSRSVEEVQAYQEARAEKNRKLIEDAKIQHALEVKRDETQQS